MRDFISMIAEAIGNHKKKILLFPVLFLVFLYFLFPFNDLGDLVSSKVTELSGGQVFVNFDSLDLGLIPQPYVSLENVSVDGPFFSGLNIGELALAPNLAGLLSFKPGVNISANELFGGDVDIYTRGGDKVTGDTTGRYKQKVGLSIDEVKLDMLSKAMALSIPIKGQLSGELDAQVDPQFAEQPSGQVNIKIEKMATMEGNVPTPFGPLALPAVNLGTVELKAKKDLKGDRPDAIEISQFTIGTQGSDLTANVTGKMDLRLMNSARGPMPQFGAYDLNVRLTVSENLRSKLGLFLNFIQSHQKSPGSYAFRVSGQNFYGPPNISALQ